MYLFSSNAKKRDLKPGAQLKIRVIRAVKGKEPEHLGEWTVTLASVEELHGEQVVEFTYRHSTYKSVWQPKRIMRQDYPGFIASKDGTPLS